MATNLSKQIQEIMSTGCYPPLKYDVQPSEIPIGRMSDREKAIYSLLRSQEPYSPQYHHLCLMLKMSLERLGVVNYRFRSGFIIVVELDISFLRGRLYLPCRN